MPPSTLGHDRSVTIQHESLPWVVEAYRARGRRADYVHSHGGDFNEEIGWPELVQTIASIRDSLPVEERSRLGILAGDSGQAGAINLYGRALRLPRAICGMNSHWLAGMAICLLRR
jgi:hypothetical protein